MKTKVALFAQGMWKYLNHQMLFPGGEKIQLTETEPERPHIQMTMHTAAIEKKKTKREQFQAR
jgi:hypothetical protein